MHEAIRPLRKQNFRHPDVVEKELEGIIWRPDPQLDPDFGVRFDDIFLVRGVQVNGAKYVMQWSKGPLFHQKLTQTEWISRLDSTDWELPSMPDYAGLITTLYRHRDVPEHKACIGRVREALELLFYNHQFMTSSRLVGQNIVHGQNEAESAPFTFESGEQACGLWQYDEDYSELSLVVVGTEQALIGDAIKWLTSGYAVVHNDPEYGPIGTLAASEEYFDLSFSTETSEKLPAIGVIKRWM